jgi:23S rRNA pseudouridine1911/1915/1917 synthase
MPRTLLDWLTDRHPTAKRLTLRRMISDGRVFVNGSRARAASAEIRETDRVDVRDRPRHERPPAPRTRLPIVFEDADLLVVDKPAGMLTSTVPRERRPTLLALVRAHVASQDPRARVGLIHRLDRDAAGLLVFSKNDLAFRSLKAQFFHHTVERVYVAITEGIPNPRTGRIQSRLEERADGTVYSTRESGKGERAITHYEVIESRAKRALVRVRLETGRKHQIRVHLAQRGTPIVGDEMYGSGNGAKLMLKAVKLAFTHPRTGKPVEFELEKPSDFAV